VVIVSSDDSEWNDAAGLGSEPNAEEASLSVETPSDGKATAVATRGLNLRSAPLEGGRVNAETRI
jgi:hypothetical protein